jgi:hypothetical protein
MIGETLEGVLVAIIATVGLAFFAFTIGVLVFIGVQGYNFIGDLF